MSNVALAAQSGNLEIHDGVAVRTGDGGAFANVTAMGGSGLTDLGATAESGNILSGLPVNLRFSAGCEGRPTGAQSGTDRTKITK